MFFAPDCSGRSVEGGRWATSLYDIDQIFTKSIVTKLMTIFTTMIQTKMMKMTMSMMLMQVDNSQENLVRLLG